MLATEPDSSSRRDRGTCPHCEATAGGCQGLHWLGGRYCCSRCTGNHDTDQATA